MERTWPCSPAQQPPLPAEQCRLQRSGLNSQLPEAAQTDAGTQSHPLSCKAKYNPKPKTPLTVSVPCPLQPRTLSQAELMPLACWSPGPRPEAPAGRARAHRGGDGAAAQAPRAQRPLRTHPRRGEAQPPGLSEVISLMHMDAPRSKEVARCNLTTRGVREEKTTFWAGPPAESGQLGAAPV